MNVEQLTASDRELIEAAKSIIVKYYEYDRHGVGAALRTESGKIVTAVHIEAYIGRVTVCAEAIAIGKMISEGEKRFDTIVAVGHPAPDETDREPRVVSPCGMCRELISDYSPDAMVIIPYGNEVVKCKIDELLPLKYRRENSG